MPIWAGCVTSSDRRLEGVAERAADPELRLVEPGPRLLHRPRRPRQARQRGAGARLVLRARISAAATGRSSWRNKLGKSPIHVALAYVLAQPFPSIPLIGPRTLAELDDSLKALDIKLTPEDVAWLDNGPERERASARSRA